MPNTPIPSTTPSLSAIWGYNYRHAPYNFFYDVGYPGKPANGHPFDGRLMWESSGPLIDVYQSSDQVELHASNAMEQGSSGSPWLIHDAIKGFYYAAGVQANGSANVPSSFSPYFEQRNIANLLKATGVLK